MGRFFPKLAQSRVFIETGADGAGFNCPMLPVSALAEMNALYELLQGAKDVETLNRGRTRMIELVKTVMPPEYHANLQRLDIPHLTELIAYLMYGDPENNDQPRGDGDSEKNAPGGAAAPAPPPASTTTTTISPAGSCASSAGASSTR